MGKKMWLSMLPRNFGSVKIVCMCVCLSVCMYIHTFYVSRVEMLHFKHLGVSAVNRMVTQTF